jgi:hypothetical protein
MTTSALSEAVLPFATDWFHSLSDRDDIDVVTRYLQLDQLEMRFPEATLRTEADFREWYVAVGGLFHNQTHDIEVLDASGDDASPHVNVTVVWAGIDSATTVPFRYRVAQQWDLVRDDGGALKIAQYQVGPMQPLEANPESLR